jgi:hypothetical protein
VSASMPPRTVVRDVVTTVRTVTSVGHVDGDALGTFGWFIGVRCRNRDATYQAKDRARYGKCVICRTPFADDDPVHMVFAVMRNSKMVGNRLGCAACAEKHATFHHRKKVAVA